MSLIGQTIKGTYQVYDEVGMGAAAAVYLARDLPRNRLVAVKAMHPHLAKEGSFLDRFRREVDLLRQIASPHVVQIYDYGTEDDVSYIVMEYVQGKTLTTLLEESGPMEIPKVLDIARQIAQCLDDISTQNIVHRDIKPGNIMRTPNGQVKIMDFGIAKGLVMTGLTQTGVLGTPYYLSPEQGEGVQDLDVRSDIYSLGIVLFQLLTGTLPYEDSQPVALIMKHLNDPIPSLCERREEIPQEVEDFITKCLAKDRGDRFQTARELEQAIDRLRSPGVPSLEPGVLPEVIPQPEGALHTELDEIRQRISRLEGQPPPAPTPVRPITPPKQPRLQRAGLLLLLALVLTFGIVGIIFPSPGSKEPTIVVTPPNLEGPIADEVEHQLANRMAKIPTTTPVDLSAPVATEVANQLPDLSAPVATEVANQLPDLSATTAAEAARQVEATLAAQPTEPIIVPDGSVSREKLDFATSELVHEALPQGSREEEVCFNLITALQELGYTQCLYASSPGPDRATWYATEDCSGSATEEPSVDQKQSIWKLENDPDNPVYLRVKWQNQLPYLICSRGP